MKTLEERAREIADAFISTSDLCSTAKDKLIAAILSLATPEKGHVRTDDGVDRKATREQVAAVPFNPRCYETRWAYVLYIGGEPISSNPERREEKKGTV